MNEVEYLKLLARRSECAGEHWVNWACLSWASRKVAQARSPDVGRYLQKLADDAESGAPVDGWDGMRSDDFVAALRDAATSITNGAHVEAALTPSERERFAVASYLHKWTENIEREAQYGLRREHLGLMWALRECALVVDGGVHWKDPAGAYASAEEERAKIVEHLRRRAALAMLESDFDEDPLYACESKIYSGQFTMIADKIEAGWHWRV